MNFLFKDHGVVFIHLPKNAGTSIRSAFNGAKEGPVAGYIPVDWKTFPSFTVIRDPFDRFLSALNMFRFGASDISGSDHYGEARFPDLTPSRALDILEDVNIPYDRTVRSVEANLKHHLWPQTHPFNCWHLADTQLRYERLEEELFTFCSNQGFEIALEKVRSSKVTVPLFRKGDLTSAEARRIVGFFSDDFEKLGYSRDLSQTRLELTLPAATPPIEAQRMSDPEESVHSYWPAYFLCQDEAAERIVNRGSILPDAQCDLTSFASTVVAGESAPLWAGRNKDLISHFKSLEPEFGGKSRLTHLLACTIVVLRRDPFYDEAISLFYRITNEHGSTVAQELNSRWLTSVCDTFVDISDNELDRSFGLMGTLFANTIKLVETHIKLFYPPRRWPPKRRIARTKTLYDDVLPFWVEGGDAIDNLFARIEKVLLSDSPVTPFVEGLIGRALENQTALGRMVSIAGTKNPPLAEPDKVEALKAIMRHF